ncbi:MAG TPA: acyl carrier protein [Gemmatimonadaceae bacterium]|nr:acyl carrier protein [Gemmatimonadaceae bacterium]
MEPSQDNIKATIKDYILREFLPGESPASLDDTTPLITGGILDSIATVRLIAFLEEQFGAQIEPHEMNADYLNFLPDIAQLVGQRQTQS